MTEFLYALIRNIDLYVQIPGLSMTSTKIPGLSRPGIQIFKFQDFPGPVWFNLDDSQEA